MNKRKRDRLKPTQLTEAVCLELTEGIDTDAGIIRGVKVLGRESKNGRIYTDRAMDQAAAMYEGIRVNIDHPGNDRSDRRVSDRFGWLENSRRKGDGVFADLHYLKTHSQAAVVAEAAERHPEAFGLSHNAEGHVEHKRGKQIVQEIHTVKSVDLVSDPATVSTLFESEQGTNDVTKKTLSEIFKADKSKKFVKLLEMEIEGEPMLDPDMEVNVAEEATPEDDMRAALLAAVMSKLEDATADQLASVLEALGMPDSVTAAVTGKEGDDAGDADAEAAVDESHKQLADAVSALTEQVAAMKRDSDIRNLLESEGIPFAGLEADDLKALRAAKDDKARKAIVESWPGYKRQASQFPGYKPVALQESDATYPASHEEFVAGLK